MTRRDTLALLGRLTGALGVALLIPLGVAFGYRESAWTAFAAPAAFALWIGVLSRRLHLEDTGRGASPGGAYRIYLFVVLGWGIAVVLGALPYLAVLGPEFWVNGLFESASGFSTTGATIFAEVESLPRSLLLWRSLTQWLGGLGIVIVFVWVLGRRQWGVDVLTAEIPGPTAEKTEPKISETARDTVIVGVVLTAALVGILLLLEVPAFDAVCHALTTLATGGFSTRDGGLGAFDARVQWVVIAFMLIGGVRFAIHIYGAKRLWARLLGLWERLRKRRIRRVPTSPLASYFGDPELRLYLSVVAGVGGLLFLSRLRAGEEAAEGIRHALFQTVAVMTTTGFSTADYDQWSDFARILLLLLMFSGGCAGSTSGSIKILRWVILFRKAPLALRGVIQPHTELRVHVGRQAVPPALSGTIGEFVLLFIGVSAAGALALLAMGVEPLAAVSAPAAAVTNVGPGLAEVGPASNYDALPDAGKLLLSALMIAGRLEIVTVAILVFAPIRSLRLRLRAALFRNAG